MSAKTRSRALEAGKAYLFAYNVVQIVGWTFLLLRTLVYFLNRGALDDFWREIKWLLVVFQDAAALEVLHACLGIVRTGVFLTLAQVSSRVFLVTGVLLVSQDATRSPGLVLCVLAWSVTEIIRYSYYAVNAVSQVPAALLFLRYSTFYLLYPLGVTGELLCIYDSLSDVAATKLWAVPVLNDVVTFAAQYHAIFSVLYYYILIGCMLLYVPMFPMLFGHMMRQRKKMMPEYSKSL